MRPETARALKERAALRLGAAGSALVLLLLLAGLVTACGGDGDSGGDDTTAGTQAPDTGIAATTASSPAAAATSTAGTVIPASIPTRVPRGVPPSTGVAAVIDASGNDERAVKAITDALLRAGVNMTGIRVYVFAMTQGAGSILVMEAPDSAPAFASNQTTTPAQNRAFAQALLSAPPESKIRQFVLNVRTADQRGPYVLMMTAPITMIEGIARGTLSEEAAASQVKTAIRR